jgi:hypothetical protein
VAAISYFQKTLEDPETVTYQYGHDEDDLEYAFTIRKSDLLPVENPERGIMAARLALTAIIKGYRKQGQWPERGAGIT